MTTVKEEDKNSYYNLHNKNSYINLHNKICGSTIYNYNGAVIIYDFFIRNQKIYFISTFWSPVQPAFHLRIENVKLQEFGLNQQEPVRYISGFVGEKKKFNLYVNGFLHNITPVVLTLISVLHKLAIATLFKYETSGMVQRFITYYRAQGCTMFYLYFNGPVLPADLPTGPDIQYRLWDFIYFLQDTEYRHCAQSVFLTTVKFRHLPDCEFLALIDMDEFIYNIDSSVLLVDYLAGLSDVVDVIKIQNHWSTCSDSGGPIMYNSEGLGFLHRTKCIYRRSFKGHFAIHEPKVATGVYKVYECSVLMLLHLTTLHKDREVLIQAPMKTDLELLAI